MALILSLFFIIVGLLMPEKVVRFMGGDEEIVAVGKSYTRIFMAFAPFFMLNSIMNSFVRNDDDPTGAMLATFTSSIFNIVMDYILMFPGKMGMNEWSCTGHGTFAHCGNDDVYASFFI